MRILTLVASTILISLLLCQVTQPQVLGIRTSLQAAVLLTILGDEKEVYLPLRVFLKGHVFVLERPKRLI